MTPALGVRKKGRFRVSKDEAAAADAVALFPALFESMLEPIAPSLCSQWTSAFRDFSYSFVHPLGFVLQGHIGLCDDPNHPVIYINNGNSSHLAFLHQTRALLDIVIVAAGCRITGDKFLNAC